MKQQHWNTTVYGNTWDEIKTKAIGYADQFFGRAMPLTFYVSTNDETALLGMGAYRADVHVNWDEEVPAPPF